ncbi:TRAP transporter large permease [Roseibium aggregatum]|uniref:TRAP transporter large permease protein n=1 Tax=Roseibium aggregatum TaxID=187304 RepID=A0A939J5U7_9HYPH|nr:TRAP transporter large permease [Roseibium aggregatum]MBN9672104.1 TRAP transporter large permease [Roseibium aggregatum]
MAEVLFLTFAVCLVLSMPVVFSLLVASIVAILWGGALPLTVLPHKLVSGIDSYPLLAIPLFIVFGEVVNKGGIGRRIVDFSQALVGSFRGGLAHANVTASMFFGGISGSATADSAAIGSVLIPAMKRGGYPAPFSVAVTATSSVIGIIIPPSVDLILYGWLTDTPMDELFAGGLLPGVLIGFALMAVAYVISKRNGYGVRQPFSLPELARKTGDTFPALVMPLIIIGGILGGVFTVTEAAAAAIVYGLLITWGYYRELKLADLPALFADAARTIGQVMFLLGTAKVFAYVMTVEQVPLKLSQSLFAVLPSSDLFALNVILICLVVGLFLTPAIATIILTPILFPAAQSFGVDPVHFGLMLVSGLALGHVTPPVGLTLLLSASIGGITVEQALRPLLPFLLMLVAIVLLIAYVPAITLLIPELMRG